MRSAVAVLVVLLSGARTMAEPCAPSARLDGDDDVAARVATALAGLGVASTAAPGCPLLRAAVVQAPSGAVEVTIHDRADRVERRVVGDATLAAVWIDSWLRDDVAAPLWAPAMVAPPAATLAPPSSAVAPPSTVPADAAVAAAAARPALLDRISAAAAYEAGWSDDGSAWQGLSAAGCAHLGRLCLGARVRGAWQPRILSADSLTGASRSDLSGLATASTSIELGRMQIAPEVGVGAGRFSTQRIDGCAPPPNCDPNDPTTCPQPPPPPMCPTDPSGQILYVGDGFHATTWTPRAAATLRVAVPLFAHVWLEGSASGQVAPGSHGPFAGPVDAAGNTLTLPGEPTASVVLGVGLRVGAP